MSDEAESVDDLSYEWEEEGRLVRRELARRVLSRGSWPTVMYLYQELDTATDAWRPAKVAIVRYQSRQGRLRRHAAIALDGTKAREMVEAIGGWLERMGESEEE